MRYIEGNANNAHFVTQTQGIASGYAEPEPEPPFVDAIHQHLNSLESYLKEAGGSLVTLSDRLLGAIPRGVTGSDTTGKPQGAAGEALDRLSRIVSMAAELSYEASRLNGRI